MENKRRIFFSCPEELPGRVITVAGGSPRARAGLMELLAEGEEAELYVSPLRAELAEAVTLPRRGVSFSPPGGGLRQEELWDVMTLTAKDPARLREREHELRLLSHTRSRAEGAARELMAAADAAERSAGALMLEYAAPRGPEARIKGIASREMPKKGGIGHISRRFLDAVTPEGYRRLYSTAEAMADRLWAVSDSFGTGAGFMEAMTREAEARGYEVIACMSPLSPSRVLHLIIPELSLAFVTADRRGAPEKPGRTLRADGYITGAPRDIRRRARELLKLSDRLTAEASLRLSEAAALEAKLDGIMSPLFPAASVKKALEQAKRLAGI